MRHPKPTAERAIPAGEPLERAQRIRRIRVVRVDEPDVAERAGQQRPDAGAGGLGSIAQRATLGVAHLVGQYQDRVDDAPDQTDSAGKPAHEQLCDADSDVTYVQTADPA